MKGATKPRPKVTPPKPKAKAVSTLHVLDLVPGDFVTGKLGEGKAIKRMVTHVLRRDALTRFRTVREGRNPASGEIWELPSLLTVEAFHAGPPKPYGCGVGMFDRARMDERTALVLATWGKLAPEAVTA